MKSSEKTKLLLVLATLIPTFLMQKSISAAGLGSKTCKVWEVLEWEIDNSSYPVSNPYDLVAKAVFTHEGGQTRKIEMFYGGGEKWKFRFCGSKMGKWSFSTVCDGSDGTHNDGSLDNHVGQITVNVQTDSDVKGFLSHKGNCNASVGIGHFLNLN